MAFLSNIWAGFSGVFIAISEKSSTAAFMLGWLLGIVVILMAVFVGIAIIARWIAGD